MSKSSETQGVVGLNQDVIPPGFSEVQRDLIEHGYFTKESLSWFRKMSRDNINSREASKIYKKSAKLTADAIVKWTDKYVTDRLNKKLVELEFDGSAAHAEMINVFKDRIKLIKDKAVKQSLEDVEQSIEIMFKAYQNIATIENNQLSKFDEMLNTGGIRQDTYDRMTKTLREKVAQEEKVAIETINKFDQHNRDSVERLLAAIDLKQKQSGAF